MFVRRSLLRAAILSALALFIAPPLAATPASAKTVTFRGTGEPFPINIPDSWRIKNNERGIEVTSNDREVTFWIEAIDSSNVDAVVNGYIRYFRQQGVKLRLPMDQRKSNFGGVDVILMEIPATYDGGPTIVRLMIADPRPKEKKGIFLGYWASPRGDKKHDSAVTDIVMDVLRP